MIDNDDLYREFIKSQTYRRRDDIKQMFIGILLTMALGIGGIVAIVHTAIHAFGRTL